MYMAYYNDNDNCNYDLIDTVNCNTDNDDDELIYIWNIGRQ